MNTQNTPIKHPSHLPAAHAVAGGVPHLYLPLLIDIACSARQEYPGLPEYDVQTATARAFICELAALIQAQHGVAAADAFAAALGFDHLMSDWEVGQ